MPMITLVLESKSVSSSHSVVICLVWVPPFAHTAMYAARNQLMTWKTAFKEDLEPEPEPQVTMEKAPSENRKALSWMKRIPLVMPG